MSTAILEKLSLEAEFVAAADQLNHLYFFAHGLEKNSSLSLGLALESTNVIPECGLLKTYFTEVDEPFKVKLALESILSSIAAAFKAVYDAIVRMFTRLIEFLTPSKKQFTGTSTQLTTLKKELKAPELEHTIHEVMDEAHRLSHISLEDATNFPKIRINDVFEHFKNSLTPAEIDFLTSGHHYKTIKEVVDIFSDGKYPDFVSGLGREIDEWIEEGLEKTPHIGKDEDVVQRFIITQNRKLTEIKNRYYNKVSDIEEMERRCTSLKPQPNADHLSLFAKKPSTLFPHLEHIWSSIHFERISNEDKELIARMEKVRKQYEESSRRIAGKLGKAEQVWPAEEAMIKMAHTTTREALNYISSLVRVGVFIRSSITSAFQATLKAFVYISKMLNEIAKIPTVNRERLNKALDTLQQKRKAINAMAQLE